MKYKDLQVQQTLASCLCNVISNAPGATVGDPMVGFLGTTMFQERAVSLFNTSQGIVMMPAVDASSPANLDRRVSSVGALSRAMQENAQLKEATAGAMNRKDLVGRFGTLTLSNGQTLEQAVAALPPWREAHDCRLLCRIECQQGRCAIEYFHSLLLCEKRGRR
jgi:hypothetical protein